MAGMSRAVLLGVVAGALGLAGAGATEAAEVVVSAADVGYIESPDPPYEGRVLVRFELPQTLSEVTVELAVLELRAAVACAGEGTSVLVDAFPLTTKWDGAAAAWDQGWVTPGGDFDPSFHGVWATAPGDSSVLRFDVTGMVEAWASGRRENHGILLATEPGEACVIRARSLHGGCSPMLEVHCTVRDAAERWGRH